MIHWLFCVLATCCTIGAFWGNKKDCDVTVIAFCLFGFLFVAMAMDTTPKRSLAANISQQELK